MSKLEREYKEVNLENTKDFRTFQTLFSLGVSVCKHSRQVEHQRCSRNGIVQKNHKILWKKPQYLMNTLYYKNTPVLMNSFSGGLSAEAEKYDLEDAFSKYGPIRSSWVARYLLSPC